MIQHPYYAKHQILTGQYTSGQQLILSDGSNYIGSYHVLPSGQYFSGFSPSDKSVELFEKRFDWSPDVTVYNKIKNITSIKYVQPIPIRPNPTLDDYQDGFMYRYFVQKRNNPLVSIMEIDVDQFNKVNNKNQPGINGVIWNKVLLKWKLTGSSISAFNEKEIIEAQIQGSFSGLNQYIKNLTEFAK